MGLPWKWLQKSIHPLVLHKLAGNLKLCLHSIKFINICITGAAIPVLKFLDDQLMLILQLSDLCKMQGMEASTTNVPQNVLLIRFLDNRRHPPIVDNPSG